MIAAAEEGSSAWLGGASKQSVEVLHIHSMLESWTDTMATRGSSTTLHHRSHPLPRQAPLPQEMGVHKTSLNQLLKCIRIENCNVREGLVTIRHEPLA